jgi:hypothetical protein
MVVFDCWRGEEEKKGAGGAGDLAWRRSAPHPEDKMEDHTLGGEKERWRGGATVRGVR